MEPSGRPIRLAPSGDRILLGDGLVLLLDDRFEDDEPGWCLRDGHERVGRVSVGQAVELCDRRLVRAVVALTSALICELHDRAQAPAGSELVSPHAVAAAKHRLVGELADGVAALAAASLP